MTKEVETHFWNIMNVGDDLYHIDLTWQQFPLGSKVRKYAILDRNQLNDGESTIKRYELLLGRVSRYLQNNKV